MFWLPPVPLLFLLVSIWGWINEFQVITMPLLSAENILAPWTKTQHRWESWEVRWNVRNIFENFNLFGNRLPPAKGITLHWGKPKQKLKKAVLWKQTIILWFENQLLRILVSVCAPLVSTKYINRYQWSVGKIKPNTEGWYYIMDLRPIYETDVP